MTSTARDGELVDLEGGKIAVRFERRLAQPPERVWRAITDAEICLDVRRQEQPLHFFFSQEFRQRRMALRCLQVFGRMLVDMVIKHQKAKETTCRSTKRSKASSISPTASR